MTKAIRWSDNDRYFGRFTYAHEPRYRKLSIMLGSGHDEYPRCRLRIAVGAHTLIIALPALLKPYREKVFYSSPEMRAAAEADGRDPFYWDEYEREFGFTATEGALHWHYGAQTHSSESTKSKVWFMPWRAWRPIRKSLYDLAGEHFATIAERGSLKKVGDGAWRNHWTVEHAIQDACPTASFEFTDFDGEKITAVTRIDEREWRKGEGKFKWMSLFWPNMVCRSLDIRFSAEVGRRKGSWKGGTIGHSIDMLAGELHEAAFHRYCAKQGLTFIGGSVAVEASA